MKSLCTALQVQHIDKLLDLIKDNTLDAGEAWSAFSSPAKSKSFKRGTDPECIVKFTAAEVATYKKVRDLAQHQLFEDCSGLCSYCRRPVGHYGWAWHIEHVIPKAKYPAHTFDLGNLTVGCVHCNYWKGARIDKKLASKTLPIINPIAMGFNYSAHIHYVQLSTEFFTFAKYRTISTPGRKTYKELHFSELERAQTINGLHPITAGLHERLTHAMKLNLSNPVSRELLALLAELKSVIYR